MMLQGYKVVINNVDQLLYYFLLPKTATDHLNINFPLTVHESIHEWIESNSEIDLYLDAINRKYTFRDSIVDREVITTNRYGFKCRDIYIKFGVMFDGYKRRK